MKRNLSKGLAILLIFCLLTCGAQGAVSNVTDPLPVKTLEEQMGEEAAREVSRLEEHITVEKMLKYELDWSQWEPLGYLTKILYKDEVDKGWIRLSLLDGTNVYYHEFPSLLYISSPVNLAFALRNYNDEPRGWIYDTKNELYFKLDFKCNNQSVPYICEAIHPGAPGYRLDVDSAMKWGSLRKMTVEELAAYLNRIDKACDVAEKFNLWLSSIMVGEVDHVCKEIKECMDQYTKLRP